MDHKFTKIGLLVATLGVVVAVLSWLFPFNTGKDQLIIIQGGQSKETPLTLSHADRKDEIRNTDSVGISKPLATGERKVTFEILLESTRGMLDTNKKELLIKWIPSIENGISLQELERLTSGMLDSNKLDVIEIASGYLRGPIDEKSISNLVGGMLDSKKKLAINYILSGSSNNVLRTSTKSGS